MPELTPNYQLEKATANEYYDVELHGRNMDKIDAALAAKETPAGAQAKATAAEAAAKAYADALVAALIDSSPDALNTLNELAAALGDDPNFATTVLNQIAAKANQSDLTSHEADNTSHITSTERTAWNNKLNASAYTAADVLAKIKTVDGSDSGLDADTVDGKQADNLMWRAVHGSITDFNTALTAGLYVFSNTAVNGAVASRYGICRIYVSSGEVHNDANNWIWQFWYSTSGEIYYRYKVNASSWGGWIPLGGLLLTVTVSASKTFALTDAFALQNCTNTSDITLTIPPNSSVPYLIGTEIPAVRSGTGNVSFAPGSGVTLNSDGGKRKIKSQYGSAALKKIATDTWILVGNLGS